MPDTCRRNRSLPRLAGLAAIIGAVALAAVYVTGRGDVEGVGTCAASSAVAKALKARVGGPFAALLPAEPPRDLGPLAFVKTDGTPAALADFAGKPVLLNLWATWCAPCRAEMPALDRLAGLAGDKVNVVAVNVDVGLSDKPARFLADIGATRLADYRDPKMQLFSTIKENGLAFGLPATLLFDRKGCQIAAINGGVRWDAPEATALIDILAAN